MRPLNLYIETSVFGFLWDDTERNASKREATETLFQQVEEGKLNGFVSEITGAELARIPDKDLREAFLERFTSLSPLSPPKQEDLERAANLLIAARIVPEGWTEDALHLATVLLSPMLDALVTWNYKHLANEGAKRLVRSLALREGYHEAFDIVTPPEAILYE
ncbi:MAG: hypothetical protein ACOCX4_05680 [Planctomycetota bacterium]